MKDNVEKLILSGLAVEIHYDKTGDWRKDRVYIYDCKEDLSDAEANKMVGYLYDEGFIMDRRVEMTIVRGLQ
jgi:hypothetical protein|tara:strand:- start:144 stop:359 length:216 start_codon:yes stop_codon:yes gene_type:complete